MHPALERTIGRKVDRDLHRHTERVAFVLCLPDVDVNRPRRRVVAPAALVLQPPAAVEPLVEERPQVEPRRLLHRPPKIRRRRAPVPELPVVRLDPGPERVLPDDPAQHVQRPRPLLVRSRPARHEAHVREIVVNDPIVRVHRHEVPDPVAAHLQPLDELVAPVLMFDEEQREVRREAFAQPDVIPVVFGDGIPEPLMRHLVDDHVPPAHVPFARDRGVAVEDGGRRLHPAPDAVRLHVRQLLVRVGADHVLVELHRLLRRHREIVEAGVSILGVDPRLDRDAPEEVHGLHGEPGDPE